MAKTNVKKVRKNRSNGFNTKNMGAKTAQYVYPKDYPNGRYIEYKMPEAMVKDLLDNRKDGDLGMRPQEYLCHYVNTQMHLLGTCVRVIVE